MLSNEQVLSIATDILFLDDFKLAVLADTKGTVWLDNFNQSLDVGDLKAIALMMHTEETFEELSVDDYLVYDCDDKEESLKSYAENYYYDIIQDDIPKYLRNYFDSDRWIADYIDEVDAGEALSTDGYEHEYTVLKNTFYIYKD